MRSHTNFDLTQYNSYKIKASCANAFFPDSEEDIRYIYQERKNTKKILIGNGNNIIFKKEYYPEDFIIFSGNFSRVSWNDKRMCTAESGITLLQLSELAYDRSLSGLEMFYDIPSSLGGAVVMNAGASGEEIKDLLVESRYYDPEKDLFSEMKGEEIGFKYRNSFFQRNPNLIITKVTLKLKTGDQTSIREKMETIKDRRWAKQPKNYPNAGSVFKRPEGMYVGSVIEELGLKGHTVGGAKISEKHAGFIVNFDNAKGKDIIDLIQYIKEKVYKKYSVDLEVEQRIL